MLLMKNENKILDEISYQQQKGNLNKSYTNVVLKKGTPRIKKNIKGRVLSLAQGASGHSNYSHWLFDILPKNFPRVISVGRLDYMSEGLILLTNNGDYSRYLEHPTSNVERVYRVCINSNVQNTDLQKINKGITIKEIKYKKIKVAFEKKNKKS